MSAIDSKKLVFVKTNRDLNCFCVPLMTLRIQEDCIMDAVIETSGVHIVISLFGKTNLIMASMGSECVAMLVYAVWTYSRT